MVDEVGSAATAVVGVATGSVSMVAGAVRTAVVVCGSVTQPGYRDSPR